MMIKRLVKRYNVCRNMDIKLVDLDATALAGYYLDVFPGDPIGALLLDMHDMNVATTVGESAKIIIMAALRQKKFVDR